MEYCNNGDLYQEIADIYCKGSRYNLKIIKERTVQIIKGLIQIHSINIIHRDIKPENIMMSKYNGSFTCKIGDFGLSVEIKTMNDLPNSFTGSLLYMAPEIVCKKRYTFKVDIWSLAILIFELFNLKTPFEGDEIADTLNNIIGLTIPPVLCSDLKYNEILKRMLDRDPKLRPSALEIMNSGLFDDFLPPICLAESDHLHNSGASLNYQTNKTLESLSQNFKTNISDNIITNNNINKNILNKISDNNNSNYINNMNRENYSNIKIVDTNRINSNLLVNPPTNTTTSPKFLPNSTSNNYNFHNIYRAHNKDSDKMNSLKIDLNKDVSSSDKLTTFESPRNRVIFDRSIIPTSSDNIFDVHLYRRINDDKDETIKRDCKFNSTNFIPPNSLDDNSPHSHPSFNTHLPFTHCNHDNNIIPLPDDSIKTSYSDNRNLKPYTLDDLTKNNSYNNNKMELNDDVNIQILPYNVLLYKDKDKKPTLSGHQVQTNMIDTSPNSGNVCSSGNFIPTISHNNPNNPNDISSKNKSLNTHQNLGHLAHRFDNTPKITSSSQNKIKYSKPKSHFNNTPIPSTSAIYKTNPFHINAISYTKTNLPSSSYNKSSSLNKLHSKGHQQKQGNYPHNSKTDNIKLISRQSDGKQNNNINVVAEVTTHEYKPSNNISAINSPFHTSNIVSHHAIRSYNNHFHNKPINKIVMPQLDVSNSNVIQFNKNICSNRPIDRFNAINSTNSSNNNNRSCTNSSTSHINIINHVETTEDNKTRRPPTNLSSTKNIIRTTKKSNKLSSSDKKSVPSTRFLRPKRSLLGIRK